MFAFKACVFEVRAAADTGSRGSAPRRERSCGSVVEGKDTEGGWVGTVTMTV